MKLAKAIITLIRNSELRKELSDNAIYWAKQFNWDRSAKELEKVLKKY